jgi:arrestin-related trafficking adapter 4/5/7
MRQGHADNGFISPDLTTLPGPVQYSTSTPASELWDPLDMFPRERWQPTLDIIVIDDVLCLQGPGRDVEPVLLSGNVALYLPEDTDIKDITLNFRGKAKLPLSDP